jgi:hypothetical protein
VRVSSGLDVDGWTPTMRRARALGASAGARRRVEPAEARLELVASALSVGTVVWLVAVVEGVVPVVAIALGAASGLVATAHIHRRHGQGRHA